MLIWPTLLVLYALQERDFYNIYIFIQYIKVFLFCISFVNLLVFVSALIVTWWM